MGNILDGSMLFARAANASTIPLAKVSMNKTERAVPAKPINFLYMFHPLLADRPSEESTKIGSEIARRELRP